MTDLRLLGLSHVGFAVQSIDEFRDTWGALLGITDWLVRDLPQSAETLQLRGQVQPAAFSRAAFARLAGTAIELVEPHTGSTRTSAWLAERGPGIHHLAFWVEDLSAAVAALGAQVEVSYSPIGVRPGLAALTSGAPPDQLLPEAFWAYTEHTGARVPWCLELLDVRGADTIRAAFGDYLLYPPNPQEPS
jgi:catechol 2,3-dioxygenase-like lactoylglutathione lyase family enzyme